MIGHLQRNKLRRTLPLISLLHSADSLRLIDEVEQQAAGLARPLDALIEVNVSGDDEKHGFKPEEVQYVVAQLGEYQHVNFRGLMCMGARQGGAEGARRNFAALRELRDRLRRDCPDRMTLDELSMGMSGDYEAAVEEGATIVRVGSALFRGIVDE
ncbi:MAG: YggS family pyridoxal phosphate-dependent enzyme [Pirellulales bacterium]